jgi:methyltransferase family protein
VTIACAFCGKRFIRRGNRARFCKPGCRQRAYEVRVGRRHPPKRGTTRLQRAWIWDDTITAFVRDRLTGHSLNVCAGRNPLCSVNLDLDPQHRSIIKGDMRRLPFKPHTFDVVVSDPPWKVGLFDRHRLFYECVRVCKVGGIIIYNATWIPTSTDVKLLETWIRQDGSYMTVSAMCVFKKTQDNKPYEALIAAESKKHRRRKRAR